MEPELVRDDLPVNEPYDGIIAEAYDVWLPPHREYYDVALYRGVIEAAHGPALELGCGNGRLLVEYVEAGLDVEGVDSSADMLAICSAHARDAGIEVTLHHADWVTLDLGRKYAALYNPRASFLLITDEDDARRALTAWRAHLLPGGRVVVSMGEPDDPPETNYEWKLRRSATRASDGLTFMVHEALRNDRAEQIQQSLHRHEVWDASGHLVSTLMRRHLLRWWTPEQFTAMFADCGYVNVETVGTKNGFLVTGYAPA